MSIIFKNNAASVLAVQAQLVATTIEVANGTGSRFPTPTSGEFFYATIQSVVNWEIVKCTARAGDVLTVERAQDGTVARLWGAGTAIDMRIPKIVLESFLQVSDASDVGRAVLSAANQAAAREAIGATATGSAVLAAANAAAARSAIEAAAAVSGVPTGAMIPFAGLTAPTGWLLCAGQSVSRAMYADLFAVLQTTYGSVDANSFNLPDLRGRAIFGKDDMGGTAANRVTSGVSGIIGTTLGAAGGDQRIGTHGHAATQAAHNHGLSDPGHQHWSGVNNGGGGDYYGASSPANRTNNASARYSLLGGLTSDTSHLTSFSPTGITIANATPPITVSDFAGGASANIPPAIIMNYIIKT